MTASFFQVSRTFLGILVDLNNAVVWMVSIRPPIATSSSPLTKPITIAITNTFPSFLFSCKFEVLVSVYFLFSLCGPPGQQNPLDSRFCFFLLIITRYGFLAGIRWSICISKPQRILCLILHNGFWFVHIPYGSMVKFRSLAHLSTMVKSRINILYSNRTVYFEQTVLYIYIYIYIYIW